jgi:hypothetical protein
LVQLKRGTLADDGSDEPADDGSDEPADDGSDEPIRLITLGAQTSAANQDNFRAKSLLSLMVERRFVELEGPASSELCAHIEAALSKGPPNACTKALLAVFASNDEIAEVFADDDVLDVLLKEFL